MQLKLEKDRLEQELQTILSQREVLCEQRVADAPVLSRCNVETETLSERVATLHQVTVTVDRLDLSIPKLCLNRSAIF